VVPEVDTKVVSEVDMGMVVVKDMVEGEVDPPIVSIVEKSFMYQCFLPNNVYFLHTSIVLRMSSKTTPTC
jgi:hypothetical protein